MDSDNHNMEIVDDVDDENSQFYICLNYQGKDWKVPVENLETALLLMNDTQAANQFMEAFVSRQSTIHLLETENSETDNSQLEKNLPSTSRTNEQNSIIWTTRKPTSSDAKATLFLLELREKFSSQFDDKKTNKMKLWHKISESLKANGHNVGEGGAERCRQKFSNLTKPYLKYIKNQKMTGAEKLEIPPFFEEIHKILGAKDKTQPRVLNDSIEVDSETQEEDIVETPDDGAKGNKENHNAVNDIASNPENRFLTKRVRPLSKSETLIKEIETDRENRKQEFKVLQDHLKKTEDQRERLLDILDRLVPNKDK